MTSKLWAAAIGALLTLPICAQAQQSRPLADPADPTVAVPPTVYESVMTVHSRAPQDSQTTPDKSWRAANDAVAGLPGHAGHSDTGGEQNKHGNNAAPAPSAPASPVKPVSPAPVDHSKHH
ncbi:hypothetical protein MasN3_26740 [Massilia varians]|uniref:Uncharacterized protein n=1 Tax=Massilia varians TaxID=457921 RepID=A0ABN6TDJ7_9BURK|nr:hypothetical protein [Massilia varians]BDT59180.1 hypothetical protein MasN3_26740 [Massilia varians]